MHQQFAGFYHWIVEEMMRVSLFYLVMNGRKYLQLMKPKPMLDPIPSVQNQFD